MPAARSGTSRSLLYQALRFCFRLTPMSQALRDRLRQRFLDRHTDLVPSSPRGKLRSDGSVRRPYARADGRAIGYVAYAKSELPDPLPATLVAFYLPQFHPIPENDEWWGKGFTEWRNVTRALPQFEGHAQPRLPGDLGFYDLHDPEVMREQARLAREYGIGAFCFYFYWFGGKTLLEQPLRNWLADDSIDLPFCLCWANEKWSRTWDGRGQDILIDQNHDDADDLAFIAHVGDYLRDRRYLRLGGKPLLLVYRPGLLPDAKTTATRWRLWCRQNGVGEIHLAYVQGFERVDPASIGFDSAVQFPPNLANPTPITGNQALINPDYDGQVLDWRDMARQFRQSPPVAYLRHPGINCGWDNEPRRPGKGRTYLHSSPRRYRDWLAEAIRAFPGSLPAPERLVFINAWNEWAEGAVLEPDSRLGHAYLQATRDAHGITLAKSGVKRSCAVIHAWHPEVLGEIVQALVSTGLSWELFVTTDPSHALEVRALLETSGIPFEIVIFENRGRDILPFLKLATRLLDAGIDVVLKLHTKRSPHLADGENWRAELVDGLVGGKRAGYVLDAFDKRPKLGLVVPDGHFLPVAEFIGTNAANVAYIGRRIGLEDETVSKGSFASGSMFWVRLEALRTLLDCCFSESEFDDEAGQLDGTFAHAMERLFGICVEASGYQVENEADVCGEQRKTTTSYRYASR